MLCCPFVFSWPFVSQNGDLDAGRWLGGMMERTYANLISFFPSSSFCFIPRAFETMKSDKKDMKMIEEKSK